ncbi:MAG: ParA family protein [Armatimonadetes bacterium]|nr:ParA family protein [Armatimonadota bacterium]
MKTIAVANQKGGVGKTATVASLAAALVAEGQRVLAVDDDPQGNLSLAMGVPPTPDARTTYDLLLDPQATLADCAVAVSWGRAAVVPTDVRLAAAEVELASASDRLLRLRTKLHPKLPFDYVLIDTPPSLGFLTLNALAAADAVLIPVQCSYLAMHGLRQLMETVEAVRAHGNPDLRILGVLLTMYDPRTLHTRQVEERLLAHFGAQVFETRIRRSVVFDYATVAGEPVVIHRPDSPGAEAYMQLAREVIARA